MGVITECKWCIITECNELYRMIRIKYGEVYV